MVLIASHLVTAPCRCYHKSQQQDVIVVSRRVLEIKLLLLCHLRSNTVIKKIKSCNHHSRNKGRKDVCRRYLPHVLQQTCTINIHLRTQMNPYDVTIYNSIKIKHATRPQTIMPRGRGFTLTTVQWFSEVDCHAKGL